jgi:hypothetical protein
MPRFHNVNGVDVQFTSEEEIARDAEEEAVAAKRADYIANHKYKDDRRKAYPDLGDQLDAILKQMNQDRLGGKALVQGVDDVLATWLGVKAAHPKP